MYTASKRIELESPGWSGYEADLPNFKPEQPGISSLIRLEAVYIWTHTNKTTFIFATVMHESHIIFIISITKTRDRLKKHCCVFYGLDGTQLLNELS